MSEEPKQELHEPGFSRTVIAGKGNYTFKGGIPDLLSVTSGIQREGFAVSGFGIPGSIEVLQH